MTKRSCSAFSDSKPPRRSAAITLAITLTAFGKGLHALMGKGRWDRQRLQSPTTPPALPTDCDQVGQPVTKHPDAKQRLSNLGAPPSKTQTTQLNHHACAGV